jgi:DNA-binding transcriptional LysR family regulator
MDILRSLQVFQHVATARSFSLAAQQMGITPTMATRHVKNIEKYVGARLLNRTSRKVSLTEAGEMYLASINPLLEGLEEAHAAVTASTLAPQGNLKICMPALMSTPIFSRLIASFRNSFPQITLQFDIRAALTNLVEEGYDLALHLGEVNTEGLIARQLAEVRSFMVVKPALLEQFGRPKNIDELSDLPFLTRKKWGRYEKIHWQDQTSSGDLRINPVLACENEMILLHTALQGVGATILPEWLTVSHIQNGELEVLFPDQINFKRPFYALYPDRNYLPAKTRCFIDFMLAFSATDDDLVNLEQARSNR